MKEKIRELKSQIKYEKKRLKCCACSKSDLRYLYSLEKELAELERMGKYAKNEN